MKEIFKKIFISIFTFIILFLLGEGIIRLTGYNPETVYEYDENPLISYRLKAGYSSKNGEIVINSSGLRDIEFGDLSGKFRIVILGDSLVFGSAVRLEDTFVKVAESILKHRYDNDIIVINAGVPGYSTLQEVNFFKKYCLRYKPHIVILSYCLNDPEPIGTLVGQKYPVFKRIKNLAKDNFRLVYWVFERYYTARTQWKLHREKIKDKNNEYDYIRSFYNPSSRGWQEVKRGLAELKDLSLINNFKVIVILNPSLDKNTLGASYPYKDLHEMVSDACRQAGLEVIDLMPFLSKYSPNELRVSSTDGHYNKRGHFIVGQIIADEILKRNLIKPLK